MTTKFGRYIGLYVGPQFHGREDGRTEMTEAEVREFIRDANLTHDDFLTSGATYAQLKETWDEIAPQADKAVQVA
jgi:hypothetical protein